MITEQYFSQYTYNFVNYIKFVMQFLKNMGAGGVGAGKTAPASAKTSYFSSLKL